MYTSDYQDTETLWEKLLDFPRAGLYPPDYLLLLSAIDVDWRVVEPVIELISQDQTPTCIYIFNLKHPVHRQWRTLKIRDHPALSHLIQDEKWQVISGISDEYSH